MSATGERGFIAAEWVGAIAFLLLPIIVLSATVPVWAERRHAATVAARESARVLVRDWPNASAAGARRVASDVAADHGVDTRDIAVALDPGSGRGSAVRVRVVVTMPAIAVLGVRAGSWKYTAVAVRRVDDYRSR